MTAAVLLLLCLPAPGSAARSQPLPRVTIDEADPVRAKFLEDSFAALLESTSARTMAEKFAVDGPTVTVRWGRLDSSALEYDGVKPVISGLAAFTVYSATGDVVSINERLLKAATPRQLAQDLAHEILGHCYERALADRAGVGYVYAVARDNETAASLLGWLTASELGEKQRDDSPFSFLSDPSSYYAERIYRGADYAAGLTAAELARARQVYDERVTLLEKRAADWKDEITLDGRQLSWIDHFETEHGWPKEPFSLLSAELSHEKDEEAPRSRELSLRIAATVRDLAQALSESAEDRRTLAAAARHPLLKRWSRQVKERARTLKERFAAARETQPALQTRPAGQITQEQLLTMIDADMKFHEGQGAPLPQALR
jgi:hypothetical protein